MVDYQNFNRALARSEFKPELFLYSREDVRADVSGRRGVTEAVR